MVPMERYWSTNLTGGGGGERESGREGEGGGEGEKEREGERERRGAI